MNQRLSIRSNKLLVSRLKGKRIVSYQDAEGHENIQEDQATRNITYC
ncbi:hypothetical protein NSIN_10215 [Nitrosotalea sinensis]|uniref:Uncharacterized protein n=1 Tax=Nitrosotalea sinensis TaxID=1499975 RepID=A0A2H1EER8_9ARCH|nr:hypothetical protein NSIN_10215 [Candidatus Nitrosotalea sinensis]